MLIAAIKMEKRKAREVEVVKEVEVTKTVQVPGPERIVDREVKVREEVYIPVPATPAQLEALMQNDTQELRQGDCSMKTYVNTSLIDAHNAQMQLEQLEGFAYVEPVPWRSMESSCLSAQQYRHFNGRVWHHDVANDASAVAPADEYINTYEISEVNIKGNASDSDIPGNGSPSISDSLSEIQNNLSNVDTETSESAVTSGDEDGVADIDEQTLPNDQFVVFREHTLANGEGDVYTGLKYSANDFSEPFQQYCYWAEPSGPSEMTERLSLGDKAPGEAVIWNDHKLVERYKQYCQFLPG